MSNNITFVQRARLYLDQRRALGFGMRITGKRLLAFARFADDRAPLGPLTLKLAVAWARDATRSSPLTWGRRLEVVRPFAKWLRPYDRRTEVPPARFFGRVHRRIPPHVYSDAEVRALLDEATRLAPQDGLRPAAVAAVLGLLACTGMRVSEALALSREDVDLNDALLVVRVTKFRKSRFVPIHVSAAQELQCYAARRDHLVPRRRTDAFFLVDGGEALTYSKLRTAFRRLRIRLGWEEASGRMPRIHDLRHTFASQLLLIWHREGIDVDRRLLDLSTYLGHSKASDTYWYLSGFPELMETAARRFEDLTQAAVR